MKRLVLFICTLLCANVLLAQTEFIVGNLKYKVNSSNPTEVAVGAADTTIITANIPATVTYQGTTYSVTSIGYGAFEDCSSLTSVTIPNSVISIEDAAFYNCNSLTSITIPNSVTSIGSDFWSAVGTFRNCSSLTSVTIGNSVTSISSRAFANCSSLTSITIPNSVTYISSGAFAGCSSLTSITIPNSVTSIGGIGDDAGAFSGCSSLTSVTIPNSVTSIGTGTFYNCSSLTSITIPNSVTSTGYDIFSNCSSLTSVIIGSGITSLRGRYDYYNEGADYGSGFFSGCSSLTSVIFEDNSNLTYIGMNAFRNCSSLTSMTIPNSVTSIGLRAFLGCNNLTSMTFECTNITNFIVRGLNSTLQNLTLGENVTSIASGAFNSYSFLQNVTCLATTPPTLADNTVFPYPNIATLTVPCGTLEAYSSATSFWNMFFAGRISENGYNVEVSVNDETFGSVAVESDCSTGTLTATANEGYRFVIWNDGNTDNPRTVALTSDTAFTAIFALIDESSLLEAEAESISFFPNPTKSEITFSQAIEKVEVIDLTGKAILTFTNAKTINIESLPAGAYYLRLTNNDKAIIRKAIKE